MTATTEEKELMLLDAMEFLRNWNQENETVLNLKYVYRRAEKLAVDLNNMEMLDEVVEYTRFYQPSPITTTQTLLAIKVTILRNYLIVITGSLLWITKGIAYFYMILMNGGTHLAKCMYIRSAAKVYEVLGEKSYRDHTMNKDD